MMKLEKAVEVILDHARAPGGRPRTPNQAQDVADAANVVEDFFVNNVWGGTEDDAVS